MKVDEEKFMNYMSVHPVFKKIFAIDAKPVSYVYDRNGSCYIADEKKERYYDPKTGQLLTGINKNTFEGRQKKSIFDYGSEDKTRMKIHEITAEMHRIENLFQVCKLEVQCNPLNQNGEYNLNIRLQKDRSIFVIEEGTVAPFTPMPQYIQQEFVFGIKVLGEEIITKRETATLTNFYRLIFQKFLHIPVEELEKLL